jgi:hypothetical protein
VDVKERHDVQAQVASLEPHRGGDHERPGHDVAVGQRHDLGLICSPRRVKHQSDIVAPRAPPPPPPLLLLLLLLLRVDR